MRHLLWDRTFGPLSPTRIEKDSLSSTNNLILALSCKRIANILFSFGRTIAPPTAPPFTGPPSGVVPIQLPSPKRNRKNFSSSSFKDASTILKGSNVHANRRGEFLVSFSLFPSSLRPHSLPKEYETPSKEQANVHFSPGA